ncbi:MAG: anthranilate phosphoribosyltransferase, partial [Nitrosomonadales bacterium]|nr:anthranilate phosphoribosyltransferase [Nitrosomonadales bacterium]
MSEQFTAIINSLINQKDISFKDMQSFMNQIMRGEISPIQISGFMVALQIKGPTIDEIAAAAGVMREASNKVNITHKKNLIDTCGTGGDSLQTFNVSTISAIVAASAGAIVAKHGGRSVSSKSGSADVLESLGVNVNLNFSQLGKLVDDIGIGFMFAPNYHPAMKHVAPVRKELKLRTIFNLLGPLTNPASAKNQVVGVYSKELTYVFAEVLKKLGSQHVLSVHGADGMDEISITGKTYIAELKNGKITEYQFQPQDYGFKIGKIEDIEVGGIESSKEMMLSILNGEKNTARDITILNSGAALYVSGICLDFESAFQL